MRVHQGSRRVSALVLFALILFAVPSYSQIQADEFRTIHLKFKPKFKPGEAVSGQSARSGINEVDRVSEKYRAVSMRRIFPHAGKYETAHRAYGLHLWYEIEFRKDARLDEAMAEYRSLNYFTNVEECKEYTADWEHSRSKNSSQVEPLPAYNDPLFSNQWHLNNTGQTGGTPGADINLLKAWEIETGKPNVIVAVIDGGVNIHHPDLVGALWVNTDEIPNNRIDDDHNGYIDDIHGYGFGDNSSTIFPNDHGTHVAGIIGAVSNNGIGISGIAGGTGSGDGVRLMSCAAFGNFDKGGFEAAMVYAADNGAVISQNSWGGGSTAIEAAIDYFVNRAGYDNSEANFLLNIQTGPIAGGLVIFAAGNSNSSNPKIGYPASYVSVKAVASTDHNDVKSDFSNYGNWVDIAAPGSGVYSSVGFTEYGILSGTSMACPQVSGVAALVTSHIQRTGLYPGEVWDRLRISARSISERNPSMTGLLGAGRVDAFVSLQEPDAIPPSAIVDLQATEIHYSSVMLEWTATGGSGNIGQAAKYEIRISSMPINESNFSNATLLYNPPLPPAAGERVSFEASAPHSSSVYYAIKGIDLFNNSSGISNIVNVVTPSPPKPEFVTTGLTEQLYTGGISAREILVKNIGQDKLMIQLGVPAISPAPVGESTGVPGRLFGINTSQNAIEELDPKTGSVIGIIPLPESSTSIKEGLAFDGYSLYYGNSDRIYKLNAKTGNVVRSIPLLSFEIRGLAWSGRYLYAAVKAPGGLDRIYEIDTDNGQVIRAFSAEANEMTFAGKRGTLFTTVGDVLVERSIATGEIERQIYVGGTPVGLGYSEAEDVIFISDGASIKAINPDTGALLYAISYRVTTSLAADEYAPGWFMAEDNIVAISPGAASGIPVTFNATGLPAGEWSGTIKVKSLNGSGEQSDIPLKLIVAAAPDIEAIEEITFGTQYLGHSIDRVVTLENMGVSDLIIDEIRSNDSRVSASISSLTLAPGQKVSVTITVVPTDAGPINALLTVSSNDPDEAMLSIPVSAVVFQSPVIEVNPASLSTSLSTGETKALSFMVKNTGGSVLHWKTNFSGSSSPGFSQSGFDQGVYTQTADNANQSGGGEFLLRAQSPEQLTCLSYDPLSGFLYAKALSSNSFYRYDPTTNTWALLGTVTGTFNGQAAYMDGKIYHPGDQLNVYTIQSNSWSSIPFPVQEETGNLTSDGEYIYVVFSTSFYRYHPAENVWTVLASQPRYIGKHGGLSYHSGVIYAHQDATVDYTGGSTDFYKYYIASNMWMTGASISGQVSSGSAIDPVGRKYFVVGAPDARQGVGIQMSILDMREGSWTRIELPFSVGGLSSLVFVGKEGYSGVYVIQGDGGTGFSRYATDPSAEWISATPLQGDLLPGTTQTVTLGVNAAGLDDGTYSGNVRVFSDHPEIETVVPLSVTVIGVPDISISSSAVDVGNVILGKQRGYWITIKNTGTAPLIVPGIDVDHPDFAILESSFTLLPGQSLEVVPYIQPTTIGPKSGKFTFHSNDPDEGSVQFILKANGVGPPVPGITHGVLSANLLTGAKSVHEITISNTGGSTMEYAIDFLPSGDWLKGYTYGYLAPGENKTIPITLDAANKPSGTFTGVMRYYVHGIEYETEIPVSMTVTGVADILTSRNKIDFSNKYVNYQYDSILEIKNNGVLPLSISSIASDNATFSIFTTTPLNLAPGEAVTATVRFNPTTVGTYIGKITFTSDDPDEGSLIVPLTGIAIAPPQVTSNVVQLSASAETNETLTQTFALNNPGGSILNWQITDYSDPNPSSDHVDGRTTVPLSAGNFTSMRSTPEELIALAVNPSTGIIYAQAPQSRYLYRYDHSSNGWSLVDHTPAIDFDRGSAVFLNSKMYCVYPENPATIFVFNLTLVDWTTLPNDLGAGTGMITTDGTLLYLAGAGNFKSLNPKTGIWTNLPRPAITLDGEGGLAFYDGVIYAHEGAGTGFAKYTIASGIWETLVSVPDKAALGSTIDPLRKRYYASGRSDSGHSYLYEYDIDANLWNALPFNAFELRDGGLVHSNYPDFEGVYFLQGTAGTRFARYEPKAELPWLRSSPMTGDISAAGSDMVALNFNAYGLNTGTYHGAVRVESNDPAHPVLEIPVTFQVTNPGPSIEVPSEIKASFERSTPYKTQLKIENKGPGVLQWNIAAKLPAWLSVGKSFGELSGYGVETIDVTFDARMFIPDVFDYALEINSNDQFKSKASTRLNFTIITNYAPVAVNTIPTQWIESGSKHISLVGIFADLNNDPLVLTATSSNPEIASVDVSGSTLSIYPGDAGTSMISVKATDIYGLYAVTQFNTVVYEFVTGIETDISNDLTAVPNPFDKDVSLRYNANCAGLATILVYDVSGKIVFQANEVEDAEGQNEIWIDGAKLIPGIYTCRLFRNGKPMSSVRLVRY